MKISKADLYKMLKVKMYGFILLLFFCNSPVFSQHGSIISNYSEELYIRTDRDLYISGENVWLKINKLNGKTHVPADLSKVVYIDLLDSENNPVLQQKAEVKGNSGSSCIILPNGLPTGNYYIRSYTSWMKNFSPDLFSYRKISVINPFETISEKNLPDKNIIPDTIIFFPEGGHIIAGFETRLGFRVLNRNGNPVSLSGSILNDNNDTLCKVQTNSGGYGWAQIKAEQGKRLRFLFNGKTSAGRQFQLPVAEEKGIWVSVNKGNPDSPVLANLKSVTEQRIWMIADCSDITIKKAEITLKAGEVFSLLKKDLPAGLFHLILSDGTNNCIAERWVYNKPVESVLYNIDVNSNVSSRARVTVDVTATDENGKPVESDFSFSVIKAFTATNGFDNKFRQMPALQEFDISPDINDNLIFYSLLNDSKPDNNQSGITYIPEPEGHVIYGNIRDRKTGAPLKNEIITLSYVGKTALCQFSRTNENGDFNFVSNENNLREIVIQPLSPALKDCFVDLNNPFTTSFKKYKQEPLQIDSSIISKINNAIISMQIKKIYEPFQQTEEKILTSYQPDFYGTADSRVVLANYIELTSLKEVIKEIMPGVSTVRRNDSVSFRIINKYQGLSFENDPLVLVDGVPVFDVNKVLNINSRDIETIDVLSTRYFISDVVLDGILNFVSKSGNLGVIDFDRSIYRLEYELPQLRKPFCSPSYDNDTLRNSRIPDFRNTLCWKPDLKTDKSGMKTVEFYASDEADDYIIIVEGITADGKKGSARAKLKVDHINPDTE